jgi:hypothetical protein
MSYLKESVGFETGTIGDKKLKTAIIVQTILFINLKINMTKNTFYSQRDFCCLEKDMRASCCWNAWATQSIVGVT